MKKETELWDSFCTPPESALKRIGGGRLRGKSDINPQWRYKVLTEVFGPCGVGWKYEVRRRWTESGANGEVIAFVDIDFFYKWDETWSNPIPGTGGAMLIAREKDVLVSNDEGYKMATTDALSVATKMIGVAADVYLGMYDEKYVSQEADSTPSPKQPPTPTPAPIMDSVPDNHKEEPKYLTDGEIERIKKILISNHMGINPTLDYLNEIGGLYDRKMGLRGIRRKFALRIMEAPDNFILSYKKHIIKKDLIERGEIDE